MQHPESFISLSGRLCPARLGTSTPGFWGLAGDVGYKSLLILSTCLSSFLKLPGVILRRGPGSSSHNPPIPHSLPSPALTEKKKKRRKRVRSILSPVLFAFCKVRMLWEAVRAGQMAVYYPVGRLPGAGSVLQWEYSGSCRHKVVTHHGGYIDVVAGISKEELMSFPMSPP